VPELVSRWQELQRQGKTVSPEELCAACPERLDELKRHLQAVGAMQSFLGLGGGADAPNMPPAPAGGNGEAAEAAATLPPSPAQREAAAPGPVVPGYEILGELGRGGMGVVYQARHLKLNRVVALKMVLAGGHAGPDDLTRFLAEAEAVAALQHPHIVQLHDFGEHDGLPFFTLEFVPGGSLAGKLNGTPLPPQEAARVVEQLARAVQYAHGKGIVHRDLKPANVLLTEGGTPKVTDFGLAKRIEVGTGLTATGAILGTPSYMAPEQAGGHGKRVGPAADVYALGAILYECLTGRPPFKAATLAETLLQVLSEEPVSVRQLQPGVVADLETICHRCLQKEPARRYASAAELADDLRRFQAGEPIRARPVGSAERAWRWCRRNPAVAGLLGAVAATLLLGAGVATYFAIQARVEAGLARDNERRAETEAQKAKESEQRAEAEAQKAKNSEKHAVEEAHRASESEKQALGLVYAGQIDRAQSYWREGNAEAAQDQLDRCRWDYRGWEHNYLHTLFHATHLTFRGHTQAGTSVCFSPDGRRLASASWDGTMKVWDAQTGQEQLTLKGHTREVFSVCFSPDGRRLASASYDRTVKVWDAQTGQEQLTLKGHTGLVTSVCFSPDGRRLATASYDQTLKVWDAQTGQEQLTLQGHTAFVTSVCFSPDGRRLASASSDRTVKVWDAQTGQEQLTLQGHTGPVSSVCFSPDGKRVVAASAQGQVRSWDAQTGQEVVPCTDPPPAPRPQAVSPDGQRVVRIENGQPVVEPRALHTGDLFRRRLDDPLGTHLWHLRLTREAHASRDGFALAFHLEPLLLTAFTQQGARPRDAFPLWAVRPPLARAPAGTGEGLVPLTDAEVRRLGEALSRRLAAEPKAWPLWAGRGWCRHLLGDLPGAAADLKRAAALRPDEPGLWAVLGMVYLKHHQPQEAEAVRRKLAGWAGIDVAVWHSVEAEACEQEGDWAAASWHVDHWLAGLPGPCPQLLARRGRIMLELGREQDAARDYAAAVRLGRTDGDTLGWHARLCLATGDQEGYRQACATLLKQFDPQREPWNAAGVAWTALLAPAAGTDLERLLNALANLGTDAATQTARGGLLLRLGRTAEAVAELQRASAQRPAGEAPVADLLLALAQHQQGQTATARRTLERVRFLLDAEAPVQQAAGLLGGGTAGPWGATAAAGQALAAAPPRWDGPTRLEVRILRREAEEALGER
jgi:tetratricopeptide (TPR) repeat protein